MFDEKKIIFNHLRSSKSNNKKVNLFLNKLSEDAIERLGISKNSKFHILEILAKNNVFMKTLKNKNFDSNVYQTFFSNKYKTNGNQLAIHDNKLSNIKSEKFDCCVSFFPDLKKSDITIILKSINRTLKKEGSFLFLFFSPESCSKLKSIFYEIFENDAKNMFMPSPDILLLGNLANSMGYKNVVVDRSNYFITNKSPEDIWDFIRNLGISNYLQNRNKKTISRLKYKKLCKAIKLLLTKNNKIINEVSINYLIATKKT